MSRPNMRFVRSRAPTASGSDAARPATCGQARTMAVRPARPPCRVGVVAAKGIGRVDELLALAKADAALPPVARTAVTCMAQHLEALDLSIGAVDEEIAKAHRQNPVSRLLDEFPALGAGARRDRQRSARPRGAAFPIRAGVFEGVATRDCALTPWPAVRCGIWMQFRTASAASDLVSFPAWTTTAGTAWKVTVMAELQANSGGSGGERRQLARSSTFQE